MRFLIDTNAFYSKPNSKYQRIIQFLSHEFTTHEKILVCIQGKMIYRISEPLKQVHSTNASWFNKRWGSKNSATDLLRLAEIILYIGKKCIFTQKQSKQERLDVTWKLATSYRLFPKFIRKYVYSILRIQYSAILQYWFDYWVNEGGLDSTNTKKNGTKTLDEIIDLNHQDILILTGEHWANTDLRQLKDLKQNNNIKIVALVYDTSPLNYPSFLNWEDYNKFIKFLVDASQYTDLMITSGSHERTILLNYFESKKIEYTAEIECGLFREAALNIDPQIPSQRIVELGLKDEPFILYSSELSARKHIMWLYNVCVDLRKEYKDFPKLIIAGRFCEITVLEILRSDPCWEEAAYLFHDPLDSELSWLYSNAKICFDCSFEGGLGLSLTEAIKYQTPCIAANSPTLIEASYGLATYLPQDELLWRTAILQMLCKL